MAQLYGPLTSALNDELRAPASQHGLLTGCCVWEARTSLATCTSLWADRREHTSARDAQKRSPHCIGVRLCALASSTYLDICVVVFLPTVCKIEALNRKGWEADATIILTS